MQKTGAGIKQTPLLNDVNGMLEHPTNRYNANEISREFLLAAKFRKRDSGSMALFLDSKKNAEYVSPRVPSRAMRPSSARDDQMRGRYIDGSVKGEVAYTTRNPRVLGTAGLDNMQRSIASSVVECFRTPAPNFELDEIMPRVLRPDAEAIVAKHKIGSMKAIMDVDGNRNYHAPRNTGKKVTEEAKKNADRSNGSSVAVVFGKKPNDNTEDDDLSRSTSRCGAVASMNRDMHHSSTCDQVMRGQAPRDPLPNPRVNYTGKDIYEKSRGTLTSLIADYGRSAPDLDRPQMKRSDQRQGDGSMAKLFHDFGQRVPTTKPGFRVRTSEARRYARNSCGNSMTEYFSDVKPYKSSTRH